MADDLNLKASVDLDVSAFLANINKLTEAVAKANAEMMNTGNGEGDFEKNLQGIEKSAGVAGQSILQLQKKLSDAGSAAKQGGSGYKQLSDSSLPRLRYAMYDVSFAAGVMGAALIAPAAGIIATATSYQSAFADVERTFNGTSASAKGIDLSDVRQQLVGLTEVMPVAFSDLTKIATLGDQFDIDPSSLVDFTKTVSEFSTVTGVSVEESATDFARLGQIINSGINPGSAAYTTYTQLGDTIANLGLKSVATESQIAGVAQQIAVTTKNAGFTANQTLALSTAFASLGVQAESARGSTLRVFSDITSAVSTGGKTLNQFADITGMSADEFKKAWGQDASGTFQKFLTGLKSTGDVNASLSSLGITAVRDKQNIGLLADNVGLLSSANVNASKSAGTLEKAMGPKLETVSAHLTELGNTVKAIFDEIGSSSTGPIASFLGQLEGWLKAIQAIEANPFAAWTTAVVAGLVALGGLLTLGAAGFLRFAGTMAALQTASEGTTSIFGVLKEALNVVFAGTERQTAANGALAASQGTVAETAGAESAALETVFAVNSEGVVVAEAAAAANAEQAASQAGVATGAQKAATAMKVAGVAAAGLAAIKLTSSLEDWISDLDGVTTSAGKTAKALTNVNDASAASLLGTTGKGADSIFSAGGGLANMASYAQLDKFSQGFAGSFLDIDPLTREANKQYKNIDTGLSSLVNQGDAAQAAKAFKQISDALQDQGVSVAKVKALFPQYADALDQAAASSQSSASSAADNTSSLEELSQVFSDLVDSAFSSSEAYQQLGSDLDSLGQSIVNNGADVALSGSQMAAVVQDIYASSDGSEDAANKLQGFFNALIAGGYASASQLANLQAVISGLTDGKGASNPTTFNLAPLTAGFNSATAAANKTSKSAQNAAKQVYTLVDYGNDLKDVFQRAFDIRFGSSEALDKISTAWQDIADTATQAQDAIASARGEISDANQKAKEAQATLSGLASDRKVLLYWKSVADSYGNTLRSSELAAQLTQNSADQASAQKDLADAHSDAAKGTQDLADAQASASKDLEGNSKQAIANRAAIEGLVGDYQDLLTQYAQSGMSQQRLAQKAQQLKQQFIQQATQAGFSRTSIEKYADSFDDMTLAINRVPRNITVSANTNPALQALNEFIAKANASKASVDVGATGSDGALAGYNAGNAYGQAWANAVANARKIVTNTGQNVPGGVTYQMYIGNQKVGNPFFATGGYVSGPGTGTSDSIQANLSNGEYVLRASAVSRLGVPFLNQLNGGRTFDRGRDHFATGGLVTAVAQKASSMVIAQLAPFDRAQQAELIDAVRSLAGGSPVALANAVNSVTANSAARGRS